jgi:hypothetical protein
MSQVFQARPTTLAKYAAEHDLPLDAVKKAVADAMLAGHQVGCGGGKFFEHQVSAACLRAGIFPVIKGI